MKTAVPFRLLLSIGVAATAPLATAETTSSLSYYAGLTYTGFVGSARSVEAVDTLASGAQSWMVLTNFNLPSNPFLYIDRTSAGAPTRFYRPQPAGVSLRTYAGVTITGVLGSTNLVQYDNNGSWTTIETVVLASSPFLWVDTTLPLNPQRSYRAVDVGLPPIITSPSLRRAQAGYMFSHQVTTLSVPPVTGYAATGLPSGLSINPTTGLISGIPASVGTNTATITATSANGPGMSTLELRIRTAARPEMVPVAAGSFQMGSDSMESGRGTDEGPVTTVTLSQPFSIGVYEVTQAEYRDVIGSNPSFFTGDFSRPVEQVTYEDATNYCALLTARDRVLGAITASQAYRLPTEAEWEYATRAGTTNRFSFGDNDANLGAHGWYLNNAGDASHAVGGKFPNPWGLHDVHGNCWEWCSDYYGSLPGNSVTDPQGPGSGTTRLIRGGSWFQPPNGCRSANRESIEPTARHADVGFRVVLAPVP